MYTLLDFMIEQEIIKQKLDGVRSILGTCLILIPIDLCVRKQNGRFVD